MGTKLERIAEISATTKRPEFTSLYHLINAELLKQCHRELDGKKAVGIDKVTKEEYGKQLESNIADLVQRLRNKSYKPLPTRRVYIPKANGKLRPLGIVSYVPYKIGKLQIQGFSEPTTPKNKITELSHYAEGRPVKTTGGLFAWKARKEAENF